MINSTETTLGLVTLEDIRAAAARIRPTARVTPLVEAPWPGSQPAGADRPLWLKCENLQPMGAFKIRGAINMLAHLSADQLARGVITYSSGNHGQAVALAARERGARAVIVMPTTAPAIKVDGARGYGADVLFAGTTSTDRKVRAEQEAEARGLTIVPPFDHPWIIAGQGTSGLEILEQAPDVATVFVPMGGGGLISGVAAALKLSKPEVRVVGVEPEGAPKMTRSREAGHPVTLEWSASIADGLLTMRPGDLTFKHVQAFVDTIVTVTDEQIARAVAWLSRHARLVVEPSGAATVAAVAAGLSDPSLDGPCVAIVSGGNVEPSAFAKYLLG
ncbi:MAG: threonine/serine dehydratase [Acidobacteria bacterium]|nr:threonine/serine dehydratase [Acidobacteriota bacterium]